MHSKIEPNQKLAFHPYFEFMVRFYRDFKGFEVTFSNEIHFCEKFDKFDFARSRPEFDKKLLASKTDSRQGNKVSVINLFNISVLLNRGV